MPTVGPSQPSTWSESTPSGNTESLTSRSESTPSVDTEALTIPNPDAENARPLKGLGILGKRWVRLRGKTTETHNTQLANLRQQAGQVRIGDGLAALQVRLAEKNWDSPSKLFSTNEMQTLMAEVHAAAENHPLDIQFIVPDDDESDYSDDQSQISALSNEHEIVHRDETQAQAQAMHAKTRSQISALPNEHEIVHRDETQAQAQAIHGDEGPPEMDELFDAVTARSDVIARTALTDYKSLQQVPRLHQVVTQLMNEPAAVGVVNAGRDYVEQMAQDPNFLTNKSTEELTAIVNDLREIGENFCVPGAPNEITVSNQHQDAALKQNIGPAIDTLNMSLLGGTQGKIAAINHFLNTQLNHVVNDAVGTVEDGMVQVQLNHKDLLTRTIITIATNEVGIVAAQNRRA